MTDTGVKRHWDMLIGYMEMHPQLAKGQFGGPTGRATQKALWEDLTQQLNAQGLGLKTTVKWQKAWTDFKYNLKKKAAALKIDQRLTGGGSSLLYPLNRYEERVLSILGPTFYAGVGSSELGLPADQEESTNKQQEELVNLPDESDDLSQSLLQTPSKGRKRSSEHTWEPSKKVALCQPSTPKEVLENNDHMYSKPEKVPLQNQKTEYALYKETVTLLKDIKDTLDTRLRDINSSLQEINESLKKRDSLVDDSTMINFMQN